jgi:protein-tyrosine kinase
MERIKEAMQRARAEREAAAPAADGLQAVVCPIKNQGSKVTAAVSVDYTRTARIPVDPLALRERRILVSDGIDPIADSYKVLRTHVLQRMRLSGWKTLAVTSPGPGDGKTVTSINLAISLAREVNQTILLVDLDLRRPSVGSYFLGERTLGISDYLISGADIADLLIHPAIDRLVILPGNQPLVGSSELLSSPRVTHLVDELRERYDNRLILCDMPPLFGPDDVLAFLPYIDAVMLVVEEGKVTKDELQRAKQLIGASKLIGVVVNKAEQFVGTAYY